MNTDMLTPRQAADQSKNRSNLNNRTAEQQYHYEMGADTNLGKPTKSKIQTKWIINISFILILLTGIGGSFVDFFDMDKFIGFLEVFAYVWVPLIAAFGTGKAVKGWSEKKFSKPSEKASNIDDMPPQ